MEDYYKKFLTLLRGYTVQGLFNGDRTVDKIVTLQTGDQGKVFFFDQEPIIANSDIELWDYVFSEPTILANSELDSEDKQWLADRYPNFIDWYFFSHALVSREWFAHYRYMTAGNYGNNEKKFLVDFGLLTDQRQYRIFIGLLIKGLVEYSFYSINTDQNWQQDLAKNDYFGISELYPDLLISGLPFNTTSYDDFGKNSTCAINQYKQNLISFEHYSKVDFILVLETAFQTRKKHLTEKIFKPIVAGKPFILAAGKENLKYLKSYGFKSFDCAIKEDYDNISNDKNRCYAIADSIIEMVGNSTILGSNWSMSIVEKCYQIAQQNRNWFWSDNFYKLIFREALENLFVAQHQLSVLKDNNDSRVKHLNSYSNYLNYVKRGIDLG